ncbi:MAG TPA: HAD family hydrolase [Gammaproteobacteria bacterium]
MSLRQQIRLLTIDLDDTLWPCMPTIMHAEKTSYDWLADKKPKITQHYSMDDLREKRKQLMQRQPELRHDLSEARRAHLRELADEMGYGHDWIEDGFRVFHAARQQVTFYEDVLPVLSELRNLFKLVALTNGNADISRVGLSDYFHAQISAADVASAKPEPTMFIEAMKQFGVGPEQTLHVGDHAIHDVYGSRAIGIRSVWVNRQGNPWSEAEFQADYEVRDLHELLKLLI